MAEQSIGMATGTGAGFGDGNVGAGYSSARMTAMETKTLSNGVLQVGNEFSMTGVGTGTLTIQDGAAVVGGYFYENTSSSAIVISTLANATYNVAILVNNTAGSLTVSRSVAGTTVGTYSVRLVVATSAQLSGQTYVQLGTIVVSGASITTITPDYAMYGTTTQLPYQSFATLTGGSATVTAANTGYDAAGYSSNTVTGENIFVANTTTGEITVRRIGLYSVSAVGTFSTGTTGSRLISVNLNGTAELTNRQSAAGVSSHRFGISGLINITALPAVLVVAVQSSLASQTFGNVNFAVSRA